MSVGEGLIDYLNASPTPFHACAQSGRLLVEAGFRQLDERDEWPTEPGGYFLIRGGSLLAWSTRHASGPTTPIRMTRPT